MIKAKAINGIAKTAKSENGEATLASLVDNSLRLDRIFKKMNAVLNTNIF